MIDVCWALLLRVGAAYDCDSFVGCCAVRVGVRLRCCGSLCGVVVFVRCVLLLLLSIVCWFAVDRDLLFAVLCWLFAGCW